MRVPKSSRTSSRNSVPTVACWCVPAVPSRWFEAAIEASDDANAIEQTSGAIASIKDAVWALRNDRLRTAREVEALAGLSATAGALDGYFAIQQALSAIDRMEVRGRDSAGIGVVVWGHGCAADRVPHDSNVAQP